MRKLGTERDKLMVQLETLAATDKDWFIDHLLSRMSNNELSGLLDELADIADADTENTPEVSVVWSPTKRWYEAMYDDECMILAIAYRSVTDLEMRSGIIQAFPRLKDREFLFRVTEGIR